MFTERTSLDLELSTCFMWSLWGWEGAGVTVFLWSVERLTSLSRPGSFSELNRESESVWTDPETGRCKVDQCGGAGGLHRHKTINKSLINTNTHTHTERERLTAPGGRSTHSSITSCFYHNDKGLETVKTHGRAAGVLTKYSKITVSCGVQEPVTQCTNRKEGPFQCHGGSSFLVTVSNSNDKLMTGLIRRLIQIETRISITQCGRAKSGALRIWTTLLIDQHTERQSSVSLWSCAAFTALCSSGTPRFTG